MLRRIFVLALLIASTSFIAGQEIFKENCLNRINMLRSAFLAPTLVFDGTVHLKALGWARHLARTGNFEYRPNNPYGENIYMGSTLEGTDYADQAIWGWYKLGYDMNNPEDPETGNFTQIFWKSSQKLGCAFATNGTRFYVVANFDPPGNIPGKYVENLPPSFQPT